MCSRPAAIVPSTRPRSVQRNTTRPPPIRSWRAAWAAKLVPSHGTVARPVMSYTARPHSSVVSKRSATLPPRGWSTKPIVGE